MIKFTVHGKPAPQGSMRAFHRPGMKHAVITSDNKKLKPWRQEISGMAQNQGAVASLGPMVVTLDFYFSRPKSAKKRNGMTVKPDVDKLARAVLDALTGIIFHDDSQVVHLTARKHYELPERVEIQVVPL